MCVEGVQEGVSTQPCGELVLRVRLDDGWGPSLPDCTLSVGNVFIHAQVEVCRCRSSIFFN